MFFMIGIFPGRKNLNFRQRMHCDRCGRDADFTVFMTYNMFALFFIPIFKWGKRYFVHTSCCNTIYEIDAEPGRLIEKGVQIELEPSDLMRVKGLEREYRPIRKCENCSYQTDEDFEYCPKCGHKL